MLWTYVASIYIWLMYVTYSIRNEIHVSCTVQLNSGENNTSPCKTAVIKLLLKKPTLDPGVLVNYTLIHSPP